MAVEAIAINILKIVFVIIGAHIAITRVVPLLDDFLISFIKDKKSVESFTSLVDIFILVLVGLMIIEFALATENSFVSYIEVIKPGFDLIMQLFDYLKWILVVLIGVVALKNIK
ncbi:MAG: hypothetical protein AABW46_02110 [Nanoarchaeota archaeon]